MSGLWVLVLCVSVLLIGTTGARVVVYEVRQARHARHVLREVPAEEPPAQDFYGSMNLEDEWAHAAPHQDWHTRTMAELSPEALDPGPGDLNPPLAAPGPVQPPIREDAQGWAGGQCAQNSRQAAGAMTGSLSSRLHEEDPGPPAHGGPGLGPASLAIGFLPAPIRLADTGDITEAHENHPHPGEDWLDAQLADLFAWVRTQLEAAA